MSGSNQHPNGTVSLVVLNSAKSFGDSVDKFLVDLRHQSAMFSSYEYVRNDDSYKLSVDQVRFANGEGKVVLGNSTRGKDVYIIGDISNYSITYPLHGKVHNMGPDEHFQDIKRVVSALSAKAKRITVIMPLLYASRQNKRRRRESADCALALQELQHLGVSNVITFDAHDPTVDNSIPLITFQNIFPTYEIVKEIIKNEKDLVIDRDRLIVISPDTGGMDRAIYYANVLNTDVSFFYKRRNYSKLVKGSHPIESLEYVGRDLSNMDILITDDMISSGDSILSIARKLKEMNAGRIIVAVSFALFTSGIDEFDKACKEGLIQSVYTTNLNYIDEEICKKPWLHRVNIAPYLARIIDYINNDESIEPLLESTEIIKKLLKKAKKD